MAGNNLTSSCGASSLSRDTWIKSANNKNSKLCENKFIGSLQNSCFYVSVLDENFYVRIQQWN